MMGELEARLSRLESQLVRIEALLSAQARTPATPAVTSAPEAFEKNGHSGSGAPLFSDASRRAQAALGATYGEQSVQDRLSELLIRLAEPESVEALTRIGVLLPRLEYALQFVAAGPELLEEGLDLLHHRLADSDETSHDLKRRSDSVIAAAEVLSKPNVMKVLSEIGAAVEHVQPLALAVADAGRDLSAVEGKESLEARFREAFLMLADPEALDALTRIAAMAPQIEYGVSFVAAGPALLEEGLELARARMEKEGATPHDMNRRLEGAGDMLVRLSSLETTQALGELGSLSSRLVPAARAAATAGEALSAAEGVDRLQARLTEALIRLGDPEVLDAIVRVATLTPDIEYAVNFVAAGPALLEEGLDLAKTWSKRQGLQGAAIDERAEAVAAGLYQMSKPENLEALARVADLMPRFVGSLDQLSEVVGDVDLKALASLAETVSQEKTRQGVLHLARMAPQLSEILDTVDLKGLAELAQAVSSEKARQGLLRLLEIVPDVERTLEVLPRQQATLDVLAGLNEAVSAATAMPGQAGLFGVLGALRDDDVQRAAGFTIEVARRLGKDLSTKKLGTGRS